MSKIQKKQVQWAGRITNIQGNILKALARYKFLTNRQLLKLQVGTTQYQYLTKQVASLRERGRPLIGTHDFAVPQPRKGRVESMHYLTPKGREALVFELEIEQETVKMPIGTSAAYQGYQHRKHTIDYQIALDQWAEANEAVVPTFDTYFDKVGNNRVAKNLRSKTRILLSQDKYFIPDGVYFLKKENSRRLHLVEVHNGKNTKKLVGQLHNHAQALTFRCTHKQFNLDPDFSYTIDLIFEHESIMKATIERVQGDGAFANISQYFLCKTIDDVRAGQLDEWVDLNGQVVPFK
jgi:hypothetical protein